jgi:hypothetical protein
MNGILQPEEYNSMVFISEGSHWCRRRFVHVEVQKKEKFMSGWGLSPGT